MADPKKMVAGNKSGDFFVDTTCINCDTCRQLAPQTFRDQGENSVVYHQPQTEVEQRAATRALLCCPTGSIGTLGANKASQVREDLPLTIAENVYYCGFNSAKSYGGNSFFVQHEDGNWLIDSPKYLPHLVKSFEKLGGIRHIFLTHRDDVADCAQYAEAFKAERIIHAADQDAAPGSEMVVEGHEPLAVHREFLIIPTPGHTLGHMVLLYKNKFLFTGDHLAHDAEAKRLTAFRRHCWYSWEEQTKSMAMLLQYNFEWVLAGHGNRCHLAVEEMRRELKDLVERMELPESRWSE